MSMRIRGKRETIKSPSTWSTLSWVERIVMYGAPILIIWVCYMIYQGISTTHPDPDIMETHLEEARDEE